MQRDGVVSASVGDAAPAGGGGRAPRRWTDDEIPCCALLWLRARAWREALAAVGCAHEELEHGEVLEEVRRQAGGLRGHARHTGAQRALLALGHVLDLEVADG